LCIKNRHLSVRFFGVVQKVDFSQFCDTLHLSGSEEIAQQLYASFKASDFFAAALIKYPTLVQTIDWHVLDTKTR